MKKIRFCVLIIAALLLCVFAAPMQTDAVFAATRAGETVRVGGFPIGLALEVGGLFVEEVTGVDTDYGTVVVEGFRVGDIIKKINGTEVKTTDDVHELIGSGSAHVEMIRDGAAQEFDVTPVIERYSGKPRLGIKIKDRIFGIGTVTFVKENGEYAALGHEIYDSDSDTHIPFAGVRIYGCKLLGVKKGAKGEAGALLASIVISADRGSIVCNNCFGIAGNYDDIADAPETDKVEVASRGEIKPGAACIRTTVDGKAEYYDIEILKATKKNGRHEKGLVFRVTDKRLLSVSGGIVRGMSGSPILQDGKLVGAVTHVMLNDFTKGYGVYADCLN